MMLFYWLRKLIETEPVASPAKVEETTDNSPAIEIIKAEDVAKPVIAKQQFLEHSGTTRTDN